MSEVIRLIDSVRRGMEDNIYNFTVGGKCSGCGNCCSNLLPMSDKEIRTIRNYIRKNHILECKHNIPVINKPYDMTCPFLDTGKSKDKCRIYEVRPLICRLFICDNEKKAKFNRDHVKSTRRVIAVREEFFSKCTGKE